MMMNLEAIVIRAAITGNHKHLEFKFKNQVRKLVKSVPVKLKKRNGST